METLISYKIQPLLAERTAEEARCWDDRRKTFANILTAADKRKIQAIIKSLNEEAARCRAVTEKTLDNIEATDELSAQLLELRYIEEMTWKEIAEKMNYSPRQIYRLRKRVLESIRLKH